MTAPSGAEAKRCPVSRGLRPHSGPDEPVRLGAAKSFPAGQVSAGR